MSVLGMPPPRLIRPRATYFITRRTQGRRFLLRPDRDVTALFTWALAATASELDVEVHAVTVLSDHYHIVLSTVHGNVCAFAHLLNLRLANAIKVLRRLPRGVVWAPGELSIVELVTPNAVVERIAYTITNPVAAGLVHRPSEWPGLTTAIADIGQRTLRAKRPDYYFDADEWDEAACTAITLPPCLREESEDEARELLSAELERHEEKARAHAKTLGGRVLGAKRAAAVSPYACARSREPVGELDPHIAAGRGMTEARIAAIRELQQFRADHREAKRRWIAGERDVVFPAGTYWMVVHHKALAQQFDAPS